MIIKIKMADANIGFEDDILKTMGLGSCIAVTLFDRARKIGGMIHFMLPNKLTNKNVYNPYKYGDKGIEILLNKMDILGAKPYRLEAKIFGGANMFIDLIQNIEDSVGYRNTKIAEKILTEYRIPIIAKDVGENYSRSVYFTVRTGEVKVKSYQKGEIIF